MGGGADDFVDMSEPEDEQGLRKAVRDGRGVHVRGDDAPYGEAVGPLVRLFRQFLRLVLPEPGFVSAADGPRAVGDL